MRQILAGTTAIFAVVSLALLPACATSHYEDVVRIAASKHPRACTTPYTVAPLGRWAFRVDACEGTLFYRCWAGPNSARARRKSMGRTQCCAPVPDETSATAVISASETTG